MAIFPLVFIHFETVELSEILRVKLKKKEQSQESESKSTRETRINLQMLKVLVKLTSALCCCNQVALRRIGNPKCCLGCTWLCPYTGSAGQLRELVGKVPNSLPSARWPRQTTRSIQLHDDAVSQCDRRNAATIRGGVFLFFALTCKELNANGCNNNQQKSTSFLCHGHFSAETKESRDPSEERVRARGGWEQRKWGAVASLFCFYRRALRDFPETRGFLQVQPDRNFHTL